jgi:ribonuclease P protein component
MSATPAQPAQPARSHTLPKSHTLRAPRDFDAVFAARVKESRGPLTILARPNDLPHARLAIQTSRRVGNAVRRNRIRRLLREAFRLMQHDLPRGRGYDLVIVVRPHEPLILADYQRLLSGMIVKLHNAWQRRAAPSPPTKDEG